MTTTHTTASPFADALRADMAALGINPRILGQRLGITQQAVDKWIRRGFPPPNRIQDLVAALGRECAVAKLTPGEMFGKGDTGPRPVVGLTGAKSTVVSGLVAREGAPTYRTKPAATTTAANVALREANEAAEKEFLAALPADLHINTLGVRTGPPQGPARVIRLDYASPKLLLDIKVRMAGGPPGSSAQQVLRLLAAHNAIGQPDPPRIVLALVSDIPDAVLRKAESNALAAQLGVEVWVCRSGAEVAARVCEVEGHEGDALEDDDAL